MTRKLSHERNQRGAASILSAVQTSSPVIPVSPAVSQWRWVMVGFAFFATTPVFLGYGVLPLLALFCILFLIGPLRADARFQKPQDDAAS